MKALVKTEPKPGLWMEDVPLPLCGANDVRIKILKTAICGTDLHIFNWDAWSRSTIRPPMVIGHEFIGVVDQVGPEVRGISEGDRVSGEGHITCGHCRNCRAGKRHLCRNTVSVGVNRDGCFAEYLVIPAGNAFRIPTAITDEIGAIFDPYGNAAHTAFSFDLVGEDVLITGAGPIGIMAAAIAKYVGARFVVITDINDYRLDLAKKLGEFRTVNVSRENLMDVQKQLGMREGFDVGLEMSGAPGAFEQMLANMNHGGRIAMLGIYPRPLTIDAGMIIFKGLTVKGIYGREMFETWYKMTNVLQSGLNIEPVITHRIQVDDFLHGFEAMNSGRAGKIVMDWI
jgi:threonine 3-dehydrogenase